MKQGKKRIIYWAVIGVMAMAVGAGCKKQPAVDTKGKGTDPNGGSAGQAVSRDANQQVQKPTGLTPGSDLPAAKQEPVAVQPAQRAATPSVEGSRPTLSSIIARRRGWAPVFAQWYGKAAPDFTLTDIRGMEHKLSDYKGRNVMLVFWATWCGPCIMEIPALIELRSSSSESKLGILAISCVGPMNSEDTIKKFVAKNQRINYTVIAADEGALPGPYNMVRGIPSSFFIDTEGTIKLATEGVTPLADIKAIIEAQR